MNQTDDYATHLCKYCNAPVLKGEPVHGATGDHWDCTPKLSDTISDMDLKLLLVGVETKKPKKHRKKVGDGATYAKLIVVLTEAFKEKGYESASNFKLWLQEPSYRGQKWDLAKWGGHATTANGEIHFSSFSTMSECVRTGGVDLLADKTLSQTWDVFPKENFPKRIAR
ncbi:hypothetical protein YA0089_26600 [Pseudomonas viridiflava]|uniref:hypothetical protein n=1 Tax=Pseudomonas viridiflava TaxID=33069 RepID=UPI0018E5C64C|nr:hypothetical protein [Pseudomonas viridiflava]MBI6727188.1 hypothetical protein [Pseudomonas viridiflava]